MTDEEQERAAVAERLGRTERRTEFQIREVGIYDVMPDDPRRYLLCVTHRHGGGSSTDTAPVTEADLKRLHEVTGAMLRGEELPVGDARP